MNSLNDIWKEILNILSKKLTPTAIATWFSDCVPVDIDNCSLVIRTTNDFKRDIINKRFADTIKAALSDLFSCDFDLIVLTNDEVYEPHTPPADQDIPEMEGYTFDRFIVGPSNKFAHAAAIAVSQHLGSQAYNPLFIYGNSGLGKTHLLLAIGQAVHKSNPEKKIAYIKGDEFINQMVKSVREGTAEEFRTKYRNVDLFLVDDIQFIAGKQSTQDEFFHTFNNNYEAGHQIVITSDRPPMEMSLLDDRLRTRFEGGLMADIQPPDVETRMAIIRNKASQLCLIVSDEVVTYIAERITSNVRQIEGVIKRLAAYKEILNGEITKEDADRAIKDIANGGVYIPTPEKIISETARFFFLSDADLKGQNRSKNTALARQISMYLMRSLTQLSLQDIGSQYEDRNHSTVLSSIKKIEELIKSDPSMASTIRDISSNINSV